MDKRNGAICHPVWRSFSGVSALTPENEQRSQKRLTQKT